MAEETTPNAEPQKSDETTAADRAASDTPAAEDKTAAKTKPADRAKPAAAKGGKEKKPAVEDKPFKEFIEQDFIPTLEKALSKKGIKDMKLTLVKDKLMIVGADSSEEYWQAVGNWQNGQRQFNLYFLKEDISGQKGFSYSTNGSPPSTLESFMIDERKVTLDLLVLYTLQRLNGQKWLAGN